jgi:hypothetical protein
MQYNLIYIPYSDDIDGANMDGANMEGANDRESGEESCKLPLSLFISDISVQSQSVGLITVHHYYGFCWGRLAFNITIKCHVLTSFLCRKLSVAPICHTAH